MRNLSLVMLAMALVVGCGDDGGGGTDSGTPPGDGGGGGDVDGGGGGDTDGGGGGDTDGGGGGDTDGGGGGDTDGGGTTATLDCAYYCTTIMANCTGDNAQYGSMDACMGACGGIDDAGELTDTSGNTLGCRIYHATAAASDAATHCIHSGPWGDGACGTPCESFCDIVEDVCPGAYPGGGPTNCTNTCGDYTEGDYSAGTTPSASGDTLACRMYHLTVASQGTTDAATHCPHTSELSPGACM